MLKEVAQLAKGQPEDGITIIVRNGDLKTGCIVREIGIDRLKKSKDWRKFIIKEIELGIEIAQLKVEVKKNGDKGVK